MYENPANLSGRFLPKNNYLHDILQFAVKIENCNLYILSFFPHSLHNGSLNVFSRQIWRIFTVNPHAILKP